MVKRSVALAAFRGGEFLAAQLDSILNQSLPPDEIILSDDSPDEATRQAVAPQLAAHPEIRYVRNPVPLGPDRNFEQAISMTTGDLIFLADQDDVWKPEKIPRWPAGRSFANCIRHIGWAAASILFTKPANTRTHFWISFPRWR